MASAAPNVEARNRSACPAGWRLPTADEMRLMASNPYTRRMIGGGQFWIAGDSRLSYESVYHPHEMYPECSRTETREYSEYPVYDVSGNKADIVRVLDVITISGIIGRQCGWTNGRLVQNNTKTLPCLCVRNR